MNVKIGSVQSCSAMQKAEKRLNAMLKKYKNLGLSDDKLLNLQIVQLMATKPNSRGKSVLFLLLLFLIAFIYLSQDSECLLPLPVDSSKLFREPVNCDMCKGITQIEKIRNVSKIHFEKFYSTKPVVVVDGCDGWSAMEVFNFDFFKALYIDDNDYECQFFPYKTEFKSLSEALNMSVGRSKLEEGTEPWYIGWSNCNNNAGKMLRKHYNRPYFLAENSEDIASSWIFMGGPGFGAHMHVDNVQFPSWQAQIRGRKKWVLAPPPECLYRCSEISVIIEPGEMIVIDTNRWYHQTFVLQGDISITIGSEFD